MSENTDDKNLTTEESNPRVLPEHIQRLQDKTKKVPHPGGVCVTIFVNPRLNRKIDRNQRPKNEL